MTVIARVDADVVQELLEIREWMPHSVTVCGLADVAASHLRIGAISRAAYELAVLLERDPLALFEETDVAPFAEAYPALTHWRTSVLARPKHQRDRIQAAAAHELQAIECERVGAVDAAELALEAAAQALRSRRRSA